ncbi:hypothetical protein K432DRAFT_427146 [Lepidopterella palustris CBS 459.81]|uniref:CFEM domain-containing protein n=1 Tax=Lepidopterella palustris CBS 459.81 TaxID=1314670 RepID=A0A8E2E7J4_9PEZI|nr:hypothetical protein K432DRAFT_427146 [Lepidopterella palustris CBS 459.81]
MARLTLLAALVAIAPFALAQTYPACSKPCIYDQTTIAASGCLETNGYCLCTSASYLHDVTCCIRANCDPADETTAFYEAVYVCSTWGVTLDTHASITCSAATSSAVSNPVQTTIGVATTSQTSVSYINPEYHPKPKRLSSKAIGGIVSGVIIALGAILGVVATILINRKKAKKNAAAVIPPAPVNAAPVNGAPPPGVGYAEKSGATVTVNQAPPPQYPATPQGQYPQQPQGQYPPQQPQAQYPQQGQYPPQQQPPQQQIYAQYAPQPAPSQPQHPYPPPQNQTPGDTPGTELSGTPIVSPIAQHPQGWTGSEMPAPEAVQQRHEAP